MVSPIAPATWRAGHWIGTGGPDNLFHAQRRPRGCVRHVESLSRRVGYGNLHRSQSRTFGGRRLAPIATSPDYELYRFDKDDSDDEKAKADTQDGKAMDDLENEKAKADAQDGKAMDDLENEKAKADTQDGKSQREDLAHKAVITLVQTLPDELNALLLDHPKIHDLIEIVMDLGRSPQANFGDHREHIRQSPVTAEELEYAEFHVGSFGNDNRAGIEGTLHRVSCIRNRSGVVIGLTLVVGKPVIGPAALLEDILKDRKSVLILGPPGIGKTTVLRDVARVMSNDMGRKVMIVDTSNEIGGYGNVPHPFIGESRRMQVPNINEQYNVMIEAVQNHQPEVVMVDEVGRQEEVEACRSIGERGVQMIATVHGHTLENLIKNPQLVGLVGGIHTVIVGDTTAVKMAADGKLMTKTIREREGPSAFDVLVEMRSREEWYIHDVEISVDQIIKDQEVSVQVRSLDTATGETVYRDTIYIPTGCPGPPSESFTELGDANSAPARQQKEEKVPDKEKKAQDKKKKAQELLQQLEEGKKQFKIALEEHVSKRLKARNRPANEKDKLLKGAVKTTKKKMDKLLSQPSDLSQEHVPANPDIDSAALPQGLQQWVTFSADEKGLQLSLNQYESAFHLLGTHAAQYIEQCISSWEKRTKKASSVKRTRKELAPVLEPLLIELAKSCKPDWSEKKLKSAGTKLYSKAFDQLDKMWNKPEEQITAKGGGFKIKTTAQKQIYSEFHRMVQEAGSGVNGIGKETIEAKARQMTAVLWGLIGSM